MGLSLEIPVRPVGRPPRGGLGITDIDLPRIILPLKVRV